MASAAKTSKNLQDFSRVGRGLGLAIYLNPDLAAQFPYKPEA